MFIFKSQFFIFPFYFWFLPIDVSTCLWTFFKLQVFLDFSLMSFNVLHLRRVFLWADYDNFDFFSPICNKKEISYRVPKCLSAFSILYKVVFCTFTYAYSIWIRFVTELNTTVNIKNVFISRTFIELYLQL